MRDARERFCVETRKTNSLTTDNADEVQPLIARWKAEAASFKRRKRPKHRPPGQAASITVIFNMGALEEEQQKEVREFYIDAAFPEDMVVFVHEDRLHPLPQSVDVAKGAFK